MGLIKGSKFKSPDGEPEKEPSKEEQIRKGGLIKAKALPTSLLPDSFLGMEPGRKQTQQLSPVKRGKILKSTWNSILKEGTEEDEGGFSPGAAKKAAPESEFFPTTFVPQETGQKGSPHDVVMIPSRKQPARIPPLEDESSKLQVTEFRVTEPESAHHIDVEALIAEAEQRGREQAAKIIEHAQTEAKKLIEQAKIYGESAKAEAHQEGFKQGKEDGYKAGLAEFSGVMEEAKNMLLQMVSERNRSFENLEADLAKLAVSIAEKVIGIQVEVNPEVVTNVIRQAMSRMKSREKVTMKVNPDDLDHVKANRNVFAAMVEGLKEMEIVADPRVDRGGCLIETDLGNTDARIKTQLAVIELAFKNIGSEQM